ncbi:lipocalin family protein [Streptacidiphilus sp. ASG 303]|uniref:lipocalin family protein n=1 Tax=Streptacidiphilus sp. ASG 303 TaxID=2896847 RepID=UPI001E5B545D|nr:lipocalin family protein [Streptacidiphilus sp. ASG 303]MCD0480843.1 lipocalin family protein [Streptacidiphilus sp. ASG 303]
MSKATRTVRRSAAGAVAALAAVAGGLTGAGPAAAAPAAEPKPVASLDVQRYLGHWYQVAAVPALYEVQCLRNSAADYGATDRGTVAVRNSCTSLFGLTSTVKGDAKPLDATGARLNVSFVRLGGTWTHTSTANYIVVGLDRDYRWAVVTDSARRSGFVLSRTPSLTAGQTGAARDALRAAGVDPCSLRTTAQDATAQGAGQQGGQRFC